MAGHIDKVDKDVLWGGGRSPFNVSYGKMMMWFFLVSDALTFGGLLIAYGFSRASSNTWPIGEETFHSFPVLGDGLPLLYVALMTFILIVSSVTMVLAVEAGHRLDKKGVIKWLALTVLGGAFFVGSQAWEWSHFIHGNGKGKVTLSDGSIAITKVNNGTLESMKVLQAGTMYQFGDMIEGEAARTLYATVPDHMIVKGANLTDNEYSLEPRYADCFFFITGFHGFPRI